MENCKQPLILKKYQTHPTPCLIDKNLILFIHRKLLLENLSYFLKKQQEQILKLCKDIHRIGEDIKTLCPFSVI